MVRNRVKKVCISAPRLSNENNSPSKRKGELRGRIVAVTETPCEYELIVKQYETNKRISKSVKRKLKRKLKLTCLEENQKVYLLLPLQVVMQITLFVF